jgi:hypothetical protein
MIGGVMGVFIACVAIALFFIALLFLWPRPTRLLPQSLMIVSFDDDEIRTVYRKEVQRIAWSAIDRIVIRTTDLGPFAPDVFWALHSGMEPPVILYGGATGEPELLAEFQRRLPGFRNDELIKAMSSTSNREFVVWERA